MVVVGVCGAFVSPTTMALVTDIAPAGERGAAMGGFNAFGSLGMFSGFLVGGLVTDRYGYLAAFLVAGGLEIAIATLASGAVERISWETSLRPGSEWPAAGARSGTTAGG